MIKVLSVKNLLFMLEPETFKPVKSEEIAGHNMHTEYICVLKSTLKKLIEHNACAVAVGTTSVRTLESLYYVGVRLSKIRI